MSTQIATPTSDQVPSVTSPEPIMALASGFMAAKHLFAANELGLFEALAGSPCSIGGLAARVGLSERAARISADAMVALGLLERVGDTYANTEIAAAFLTGEGRSDLRPFLRFWDKISYPAWTGLADALATGPSAEIVDLPENLQQLASAGIEAILAGPAAALAGNVEFPRHRHLLDIGGGTGSWSMAVLRRHPHMQATVLELPTVAEIARHRVAEAGLAERIDVIEGDAMAGPLPTGHDVCLVANLVHYFSPAENQTLLGRIRRAFDTGTRLLLADFWTDRTHTEPVIAALMAGEFAVHLRHGDVYSVDEARQWLDATGWRFVEHAPLAGPVSLVVAETR